MSRNISEFLRKYIYNSKEFRIKLGENIRKARLKIGLTQAQLGKMLGKSDNVITNWEKGTNRPDADMIEKLCSILKISPNELLNWEQPAPKPATIAAHFDGEEFTEEEIEEINNYIKYVISKRKNNK